MQNIFSYLCAHMKWKWRVRWYPWVTAIFLQCSLKCCFIHRTDSEGGEKQLFNEVLKWLPVSINIGRLNYTIHKQNCKTVKSIFGSRPFLQYYKNFWQKDEATTINTNKVKVLFCRQILCLFIKVQNAALFTYCCTQRAARGVSSSLIRRYKYFSSSV